MSDLDRRLPGVSDATVRWIHSALTLERLAFVDRALAGTLLRLGAPRDSTSADVLALGTVLASSAPREGHTLFDLGSEQEPFPPLPLPPSLPPRREWEALLSSLPSVVGRPEAPAPLVVEGEDFTSTATGGPRCGLPAFWRIAWPGKGRRASGRAHRARGFLRRSFPRRGERPGPPPSRPSVRGFWSSRGARGQGRPGRRPGFSFSSGGSSPESGWSAPPPPARPPPAWAKPWPRSCPRSWPFPP